MSLSVLNSGGGGGSRVTLDGERVKELAMTSYKGANPYTMGAEGMTFAANTLLKDGLRIINGVNDKGEFLWKRRVDVYGEVIETQKQVVITATDVNGGEVYVYYATSYGYDEDLNEYYLNQPTLMNDHANSSSSWIKLRGKYVIQSSGAGNGKASGPVLIKVGNSATFTQSEIGGTTYYPYTLTASEATVYEYKTTQKVDYVVSSDSEAYPDGAEQDGYWYELVEEGISLPALFGCTKIAIDTFTPSARTSVANFGAIPHSLGEIPRCILLVADDSAGALTTSEIRMCYAERHKNFSDSYGMCGYCSVRSSNSSYGYASSTSEIKIPAGSITNTNITILSGSYAGISYLGKTKYTLITMA